MAECRSNGIAGIGIRRRYFRHSLRATAKATDQSRLSDQHAGRRIPINFGDTVRIGETIEVELTITADQTYEYLAFEDPKLAGCEPLQLRSGNTWADGLRSNVELRDQNVVFFISWLPKGQRVLRYKLRAEVTGRFHVLPTNGFAMYAPEIRARSDEMRISVHDSP